MKGTCVLLAWRLLQSPGSLGEVGSQRGPLFTVWPVGGKADGVSRAWQQSLGRKCDLGPKDTPRGSHTNSQRAPLQGICKKQFRSSISSREKFDNF